MEVELAHVAAGCNRIVSALDWGENGLIAYGAHHATVVYDPLASRVVATVLGHTGAVTCVRWFSGADLGLPPHAAPAPAALATGSVDGTVRVWWVSPGTEQPWRLAATLEAHSAPVNSVALHAAAGGTLLVSAAGDGDACVWECAHPGGGGEPLLEQAAWRLTQRLRFGTRLQHSAALAELPGAPGCLLLALGGVDCKVRLLLRGAGPGQREFAPVCELSGHQDWVRGLAFTQADGRLLLASASQDKYIRLWAVAPEGAAAPAKGTPAAALGDAPLPPLLTRFAPRPRFAAGGGAFSATLEALLIGHEDWVHSVAWAPPTAAAAAPAGAPADARPPPPCLLSASMDRTMTMWVPDAATGLWLSRESVGDAGANHLGYYTGAWSPSGDAIAAHGFTGALHTWARAEGARWAPRAAAGGHYAAVVDCCWAAGDGCLLTAGADQTARVTARLTSGRWCEVARPQVHGHDFACVAALPPRGGGAGGAAQYFYAAGSEEKVIRVLQAPQAFHDTLAMAQGGSSGGGGSGEPVAAAGAYGATLPALGLSNKAVYAGEDASAAAGAGPYDAGPDVAPSCAPSAVGGPPLEEHLAQNTLWPEAHKLYGHGNEVYCLAADPRGELLASAARAQSPADAAIWLWDAARWAPAGALDAHALTVTQLAFSPDGERLASASRDRSVGVFARRAAGAPAGAPPFALVGKLKAHARIVWALAWSPDSRLLATASRDGSLKVWAAGGEALPGAPLCALPMGDAVRSVAFAPAPPAGTGAVDPGSRTYLLAAGLESGVLCVLRLTWGPASGEAAAREVWRSSVFQQHAAAVRRVCWRAGEPAAGGGRRQQLLLASCGDDHSVRIFACSAPQDGGE